MCLSSLEAEDWAYLDEVHAALELCILSLRALVRYEQPTIRPYFETHQMDNVWQCTGFCQARPGRCFKADVVGMFMTDPEGDHGEFGLCQERHGDHVGCMTRASEQLEQEWILARHTHGKLKGFHYFTLRRGHWFSSVGIEDTIYWDLSVARHEACEIAASRAAANLAAPIATPKKTKREASIRANECGTNQTRKVATQRVASLAPDVVKKAYRAIVFV